MKRIAAFQAQGREVIGVTFHRVRDKADVPPTWENIHLGTTFNRRYLQRLFAFVTSLGVLWKHRERLGACSVFYVINTDNAVLALLGGLFSGRRVPLVLELADIQPAMTGTGLVSKILRAIERAVLNRCALLVTTSPGFIRSLSRADWQGMKARCAAHPREEFTGEADYQKLALRLEQLGR